MVDTGAGGAAAVGSVGADDAIAHLYAGHWTGLVRLAWLLLRDDQLAEEVAQDAFIAVHANWGQLRDHTRGVAYLRRSVVNGARSRLRHRGVEERYLERQQRERGADGRWEPGPEDRALERESHAAMIHALARLSQRQREVLTLRYLERQQRERGADGRWEPGPEDRALERESHAAMVHALGRLSQRQREVLTLRYYLDLSEAEIADALGISAGSVKAHAHRGLAALRDDMENRR